MSQNVWKDMYLRLVKGILAAEERIPVKAENSPALEALNQALQDAEELYLSAGADPDA